MLLYVFVLSVCAFLKDLKKVISMKNTAQQNLKFLLK